MIHFTERKLKAIMAKFGVTLDDLKEENALGKIYGEYQLPMNVGILLALCDQSRVEFARNLGVSPGTVTYFLNPDHRPTARMIKKLSKYFNVPANRLLFGYANVKFELERDKARKG
jgi:transcriptional regulator with XRE-family HTH domain